MKRKNLFALVAMMVILAIPSMSQTFADGPWSGSIQCQVNVDLNDFSRHETQTWTLTGKKLAPNGQMRIYEAAWTVTGQGQFLARSGQTTAVLTKWTMNVPAASAALSFFMTPNQLALRIQNWSQTRADNAISATQQQVQNGVVQPQTQPRPSGSVHEWNFGVINEGITSDTPSGTKSFQVANLGAGMQQYGAQNQTATCNWQFTKGAAQAQGKSEPQKCAQADASINKTFNSLEADVAKQFEALIQQTTDPIQGASLKNQEQSVINQLENLKKQNLQANSGNCQSGSNNMAQNPPGTETSDPNQTSNSDQAQSGSGGTGNQACSLSDVASMYDNLSQSLQVAFAKLIQQAQSARSDSAALAATGNQQAKQQVQLMDQIIAKFQEDEQKALQNVSKQKDQVSQQIQKAKTVAEQNAACQAVPGNVEAANRQIVDLTNSDVNTLNSIVGTDPTKQPQGGGADSDSQTPQLLKVEPASAQQNTTTMQVALTGRGTHWLQGTPKLDFGPGITVQGQPVFLTATDGYVAIAVAPNATVGARTVTVTSPFQGKTETVALPNSFTVTAPAGGSANVPISPNRADPSQKRAPAATPANTPLIGGVKDPGKHAPASAPDTPPPPPTSGRYLITVSGVECIIPTLDSPTDGKGNEIYPAVYWRRYDRNAGINSMDSAEVQTQVYGDINQAPDRIQGGTVSPLGGIGPTNFIPDKISATEKRTLPANDGGRFPLRIWEGTLTDGVDVLAISPSVWEADGSQTVTAQWLQNQSNLSESLLQSSELRAQISGQTFGVIEVGATQTPLAGFNLGGGYDRPIGVVGNDPTVAALPNKTLVLTREIIEAALGGPRTDRFTEGAVSVSGSRLGTEVNRLQQESASADHSTTKGSSSSSAGPPQNWKLLKIDFMDKALGPALGADTPGYFVMYIQIERE